MPTGFFKFCFRRGFTRTANRCHLHGLGLFCCSRASLYVRQYDRSHTASPPGRNAGPGRDVATAVPQGTYPLIAHFPTGTVYATHLRAHRV